MRAALRLYIDLPVSTSRATCGGESVCRAL